MPDFGKLFDEEAAADAASRAKQAAERDERLKAAKAQWDVDATALREVFLPSLHAAIEPMLQRGVRLEVIDLTQFEARREGSKSGVARPTVDFSIKHKEDPRPLAFSVLAHKDGLCTLYGQQGSKFEPTYVSYNAVSNVKMDDDGAMQLFRFASSKLLRERVR